MDQQLTAQQRANLARLADHLDTVPLGQFDMRVFRRTAIGDGLTPDEDHPCGSVGCAVGHGPAAGIPVTPVDYSYWDAYCARVFGAMGYFYDDRLAAGLPRALWEGLFTDEWSIYEPFPDQAAARIRAYLTTGLLRSPRGTVLAGLTPSPKETDQ